jgi:hypothetical protein
MSIPKLFLIGAAVLVAIGFIADTLLVLLVSLAPYDYVLNGRSESKLPPSWVIYWMSRHPATTLLSLPGILLIVPALAYAAYPAVLKRRVLQQPALWHFGLIIGGTGVFLSGVIVAVLSPRLIPACDVLLNVGFFTVLAAQLLFAVNLIASAIKSGEA